MHTRIRVLNSNTNTLSNTGTGLHIYVVDTMSSFVDAVDEEDKDSTKEMTEEEQEEDDDEKKDNRYLYQSPPMRKKRSETPPPYLLDSPPHLALYEMFKSSSRPTFSNLKVLKRALSLLTRVRPGMFVVSLSLLSCSLTTRNTGTQLKQNTRILLLLRSNESLQRVPLHPTRLFVSAKVHETILFIPQQNLNFGRVRSDTSRVRSFTLINSSSQPLPYRITTSGT